MTDTLLVLAGFTQLGIALASLALPRILGWREQTARLEPLTRHVFWTYAAYIFGTNLFFAGVSILAPHWLSDGSPLGRVLCGFITVYWGARLLIQVFAYRTAKPEGWFYAAAEIVFALAFAYCSGVYGGVGLGLL